MSDTNSSAQIIKLSKHIKEIKESLNALEGGRVVDA